MFIFDMVDKLPLELLRESGSAFVEEVFMRCTWDPDKVLEVWQFVDKSLCFRNRAGRIIISNEDGDWHSDRFNGVLSGRGLVGEGPVIDVLLVALNLVVLELRVENLKRNGLSKVYAILYCFAKLG